MKRKPKAPSDRTTKRAAKRKASHLVRDRERLVSLSPGGTAARPIEVTSASVIEPHAVGLNCPLCEGPEDIIEHLAKQTETARVREVRLRCRRCGRERSCFFRILVETSN